ncbi:XRE family transcriptional regulator [Clostridium sediminicola]|uniref:helix-turn-helix domain-containing protein n=1 Tax=Clostridium sediminicola TaxID=3114879 RepID=UPI0031F1CE31
MNLGKKIKAIRVEKGLTQEEVADRCELSKGFISQVERDLTSPSIATLSDMLESLGTNLKEFFSEPEEEKIIFSREDIFEVQNDDLLYKLEWVIPNAQKNMMEPILLTLDIGGRYDIHEPHEGEEFGYVLSGMIYINLGNKKYRARKGECFYYKAKNNHYIENASKLKSKVLWVSTPPSF